MSSDRSRDRGGRPGSGKPARGPAWEQGKTRPSKPAKKRGKKSGGGARKPPLRVFTTTLWEYPSQHYGETIQGDKHYVGATPSWVIWQLLQRYTRPNDLVVDPMCGSGTTIDVARSEGRRALGYDLAPTRDDIARADARSLPLEHETADFVFVDPPYSTHVNYSDDPRCIGRLDAGQEGGAAYYEAMAQVIDEIHRVLRNRRFMGLYVSDSFRKRKAPRDAFMPIGFELFSIMRRRFRPVDIISVARKNEKLSRGAWRKAAEEGNFFLRGFNYLFIMKKEDDAPHEPRGAERPKRKPAPRKGRTRRSSGPGAGKSPKNAGGKRSSPRGRRAD